MKRIILFGAPGSGKGTQAKALEEKYGYKKISTGDIIRAEVAANTETGLQMKSIIEKGELVPDNTIIRLLQKHIEQERIENGYILDGFPRTDAQAEALSFMKADYEIAIYLKIGDENVVIQRMLSRLTCGKCGAIYNLTLNPPANSNVCDKCGGDIGQRTDDNEDTFRYRMQVYREQTKPVIDYYRGKGLLVEINALASVEEVFQTIEGILR